MSAHVNGQSKDAIHAASERLRGSVLEHALRSPDEIDRRLQTLTAEKDVERVMQTAAAVIGMAGLFLGIFGRKRYLLLPALVLPFLYQEGSAGESPASRALRKLGLRSRREILQEYYALKVLKGDFAVDDEAGPAERASNALRAVDAE